MRKVKLNTELPGYLVFIFLLFYLLLTHYLHGAKETCLLVNHHHHLTKLTFSHFFSNNKVTPLEHFLFFLFSEHWLSLRLALMCD